MTRTKVAIIGSGNIGTDLMIKVMRLSAKGAIAPARPAPVAAPRRAMARPAPRVAGNLALQTSLDESDWSEF